MKNKVFIICIVVIVFLTILIIVRNNQNTDIRKKSVEIVNEYFAGTDNNQNNEKADIIYDFSVKNTTNTTNTYKGIYNNIKGDEGIEVLDTTNVVGIPVNDTIDFNR